MKWEYTKSVPNDTKGVEKTLNINLLKAQIALKGKNVSEIVKILKISKSAWYRKIRGKSDFTRQEICILMDLLEIETDKAMKIFFDDKVS